MLFKWGSHSEVNIGLFRFACWTLTYLHLVCGIIEARPRVRVFLLLYLYHHIATVPYLWHLWGGPVPYTGLPCPSSVWIGKNSKQAVENQNITFLTDVLSWSTCLACICWQMSFLILSPRIKEVDWPFLPHHPVRENTSPLARTELALRGACGNCSVVILLAFNRTTSFFFQIHQSGDSEWGCAKRQ